MINKSLLFKFLCLFVCSYQYVSPDPESLDLFINHSLVWNISKEKYFEKSKGFFRYISLLA